MTSNLHAASASGSFASMIDRGASFDELRGFLDSLDRAGRITEMRTTGARQQKKLWELTKGHVPVVLTTFVDKTEETIIYEGKNSLPTFSLFQKRFFRTAKGDVVGYNHNGAFATFFSGPGYFVTEQAPDGELAFDYTKTVTLQPPGWPALAPNSGLIPGIVFGGMIDYVRHVADGVVIGAAFKGGKPRNQYFMLART
ncbi:hypothetical protein L6R52_21800 [Myxococcota bacterium]|nr:hypothetical protein [Myxococcota bacterium]